MFVNGERIGVVQVVEIDQRTFEVTGEVTFDEGYEALAEALGVGANVTLEFQHPAGRSAG
jgi:hypothetical protein